MYQHFYNFTRPPFDNIPDPGFLYLSPQHERVLSVLKYALLSRTGFCVITGNVGAGKTTLVRSILYDLGRSTVVGLVSNTQCDSFEELMRWILLSFNLEYRNKDKVEMYDDLVQFLIRQNEKGNFVTLIIDEAQHLDMRVLEQLRMLSNVNTERGQLLQIVLVGQPELSDLLRKPEIQQFAQRISYDHFLGPLESAEITERYVRHRLSAVSDRDDIFEPNTYALIHKASGGIPRLINMICDTSLVYGFAEELQTIPLRIIEQVLADKRMGLAPLQRDPVETSAELPVNTNLNTIAPVAAKPRHRTTASLADSIIERAMARKAE
ncbi:MAG: AAA family ATPase [Pseudomonadales bacterium]|nr:AAA family ATPase [Pseudomonadales bacterium]MCP5185877.1 AAA family ATPase [Pseudomonadales bacterium]